MLDLILAVAHHILIFGLFGVLFAELLLLRRGIDIAMVSRISSIDLWYGITAGLIIIVGFSRAVFAAKGWDYYSHNAFFWAKIGTFAVIGVAAASARLMKLSKEQTSHAISMAAVANNIVKQVRTGHLSMWKAVAAGQAGRSGVFAAILAAEGMEGPHLPFEGNHGWCKHVSGPFTLAPMGWSEGGKSSTFKIEDTLIKQRSSCATTISSILAAEKASAAIRGRLDQVKDVKVEVYDTAKKNMGTGEHHWNPQQRETADHSIPYVTSAALMDGTVTPRQFNDAHIWSPELRKLLAKVEVVENPEFTKIYHRLPVEHHTRVTVTMADGERIVGESGGTKGDLSNPKSDEEISAKFRGMTEDCIGGQRVTALLDKLWKLEALDNVAEIPPAFLFA